MRKSIFVLTTLAATFTASLALAEQPANATTSAGAPRANVAQPSPAGTSSSSVAPTTSTTTATSADTSADATPIPTTPIHDDSRSVTLKQSFHPNRPMLFAGGATFLGTYATTAALTAANDIEDNKGNKTMYLPVVGPWIHLANSDVSGMDAALVVGSGVLQGAGVGLAIASVFVPEKVAATTIQAGGAKVQFTATSFGRGSGGFGAVGQF